MTKSVLHLDLHPIARRGHMIDSALDTLFEEAQNRRVKSAEIIPGKGSGALMKRVRRYLSRKDVRARYKRLEVDEKNHGRLFVHFR